MYCQNCGSEIEQNTKICPYCGEQNNITEVLSEKDKKIKELEQKILNLEQNINSQVRSRVKRTYHPNKFMWIIFVFPIAFLITFFVFFTILASR
jgi:uncharacterized membrane protein YvbJ